MRTVAAYALEKTAEDGSIKFPQVVGAVKDWLIEKGWKEGLVTDFQNNQGNKTRVLITDLNSSVGRLSRFAVIEQLAEAIFSTEVSVASRDDKCALFVELRVGGAGPRMQPFRFDARRPKFIGKLLHNDLSWQLGDTPLTDSAYAFNNANGGKAIVEMLWHKDRTVPAVVVSLLQGGAITSNFVDKLAGDLAGLAIVATLNEEASWALTKARGADWSCFNGAVRLYWPMGQGISQPRLHPLWLRSTIVNGAPDLSNASYRMRAQLRRQILGVSAFSIREPKLIRELNRAARQQRQEQLLEALKTSQGLDEYRAIAESYAVDNDALREELKEKEDRLGALEDQVSELQLALRYQEHGDGVVLPDLDMDPASISDALDIARRKYPDRLIFADTIDEGVEGLHPEAGPPTKVLRYLQVLHDLGAAREAGPLGIGIIPWLEERGVTCSVESETIRNAGGRQWLFSGLRVNFDLHLKPSDSVSPDRCVRIYFEPVMDGKIKIGWIGRHPG